MRYIGKIYRPPSEADAFILQATIGCSWNACTYCDMYRDKRYRIRPVAESLAAIDEASAVAGDRIEKLFVADGDALDMPLDHWVPLLEAARDQLPRLRRVSCYATARNLLEKTHDELEALADLGLSQLYIGPESGDDVTLKRIAKGASHDDHVRAAEKAHAAGMRMSVIALLGIGMERWQTHAEETGRLVTRMDPAFFSALTVTVVPGTPLQKLADTGRFEVPGVPQLLRELQLMVAACAPTDAVFRTNHASNYLPLGGRLPRDNARIGQLIDAALDGRIPLRPEHRRGL